MSVPPLPFAGAKLWHWLKLAPGVAADRAAISDAADAWLMLARGHGICGHVRHLPLPAQGGETGAKAHFGGGGTPRFDAVLVSWVASREQLAQIEAMPGPAADPVWDAGTCFTLHTTETIIFDAMAAR